MCQIDPMNWLNYHHLMYFKAIATEGSISKASEKLLVGQPALSAQLKQLEEAFGKQLFERRNRKLFLTDAGKIALRYANQIHSLGTELQTVLGDQSLSIKPHIQLGALDSVPKSLVVKLVEWARRNFDCHVTLLDGTGDSLYRQLDSFAIDLVLSDHHIVPAQEGKSIQTRSIGKVPISIYSSEKFEGLKEQFPSSISGQPLVVPTKHSKLRHDLDHYFETHNITPNIVAETQDTTTQKLLAADSYGLIAEPHFAVKHYVKEGKLIKLGRLAGVYEEFFLISNKRVIENPVAIRLMNEFKL